MRERPSSLPLWSTLLLLAALSLSRSLAPPSRAVSRPQWFSTFADPTTETLRIEYHGGLGGPATRFVLTAGGRLIGDSFELQLSEQEAARLVRAVLEAEELGRPVGHREGVADPSSLEAPQHLDSALVTIHLDTLRASDGTVISPFLRRVEVATDGSTRDGRTPTLDSPRFEAVTRLLREARDVASERSVSISAPARRDPFPGFSSDRRYTLSDSGGLEVLRVEHRGGDSPRWGLFQLFGDGRLVLTVTDPTTIGSGLIESYETVLSRDEMTDLVDPLVHSGFVESDDERILAAVWASPAVSRSSRSGGGSTRSVVELRLAGYAGPDGREHGATYSRLQVPSPHGLARAFPTIDELQGIAQIHQSLVEIGLSIRDLTLIDDPSIVALAAGEDSVGRHAAIEISSATRQPVLRLTRFASDSAEREIFTLFGDGRLERSIKELGLENSVAVVDLSWETVAEIVRLAVAAGLLTTSQRELWNSIRGNLQQTNRLREAEDRSPVLGPISAGSGHSSIELWAESFGHLGSRSNRLTLFDLEGHHQAFPQIRELEAWTDLVHELNRWFCDSGRSR